MRRLVLTFALALAAVGCGRGSVPVGIHERETPTVEAEPAARPDISRMRQQPVMEGWPGVHLNDRSYGGTSSWTADGYPPAGDWYAPRPKPTPAQP